MQRKDALGKLECRVCNVSYMKRLTPLDKEVDVYCAWIDNADQLNNKGKKQTLGLTGGKNESDSDEEHKGQEKKQAKEPDFDDSEEEVNEVVADKEMMRKLSSDPYSASEKIAELGLGQAAVEKKIKVEASPSVGAEKAKSGLGAAIKKIEANPEQGQENESDDSDDLF